MKPVYIVFRRTLSASKRQAIFLICANIGNDHFTVHISTNNSLTERDMYRTTPVTYLKEGKKEEGKRERKRKERGGERERH